MTKPFNTKEPVQTREGKKARIICTDAKGEYPIIALVEFDSHEAVYYYRSNGEARDATCFVWEKSQNDLVNVPQKRTVWVNMYPPDDLSFCCGYTYTTRQAADEMAVGNREACVEIEYTEGEGL
jgi:hypothetical protein